MQEVGVLQMSTVGEIEMLRRLAALSRSYQNYLKGLEDAKYREAVLAHWNKLIESHKKDD